MMKMLINGRAVLMLLAIAIGSTKMAMAQPAPTADPLAKYKQNDYVDVIEHDRYLIGKSQYEKMATHSITAVQTLIYQQILNGKLVAYKDAKCTKPMTIKNWEEKVLTHDTLVTLYYDDGGTETYIESKAVVPFVASNVAEWSYYNISTGKNGKKPSKRKPAKGEKRMAMDINPWDGEVAIGFRPFRQSPEAGASPNVVTGKEFFFIKAKDLKKLLNEWDQELIGEFSMLHALTSTKDNHVYINPVIVNEWADSMQVDAKRTIWNACRSGKVPVYVTDSFGKAADVKQVERESKKKIAVFDPDDFEEKIVEEDVRLEDVTLHIRALPAIAPVPYTSIYVTHVGFTVQGTSSYADYGYTFQMMHSEVDDVMKALTKRQMNFLRQAMTFRYGAE